MKKNHRETMLDEIVHPWECVKVRHSNIYWKIG